MFLLRNLRKNNVALFKYSYIIKTFKNASVEDVPSVSSSSIKKTFKSSNIEFEEGHTCFKTQCPICKLNSKPTISTLYVNKTTGLFMCPKCKHSGEWDFLLTYLTRNGKKPPNLKWEEVLGNSLKIEESVKSLQQSTIPIGALDQNALHKLLKKLKLPVVDKIALESLKLRVDGKLSEIYFPLQNADGEVVGYKIIGNGITTFPDTKCGGLLKGTPTKATDVAVLVGNLADFLILSTSNINATTICSPNGIKSLPQYVLPTLEKYKKIVLWLGSDTQAWDTARRFGKKLGEKRCYCVRPNNSKAALPHLDKAQDFISLINNAQRLWHKSITTFASLRQDVLSDLQNMDQVEGIKWQRFPSLNKILKGHRMGEMTVLTGPTGSGKTTFISEYSLDLALQGVSTLWGSFEIRNARLARTMMQQMVGMPLEKNLHLFETWADEFEKLPLYYMTFHGQQSIKVVMEAVEHAAYVHDISHVIIDNLQFMMGVTEESKHMDRYWKQDAIVAAFRTFASRKNCHVTLVIHPRKERVDEELTTSSIFGGAKASQEADNVLLIQDKRLTGPRGKKYLQVAKNRYSGDLGVMALDFDKDSLSYAPKKKKKSEVSPEHSASEQVKRDILLE
ncbi:mitochondrial DNA helicase [Harmonia axyridis]|uniref:mitochondrial DNA helicase n=1 Tax=Harmonia axyridis TaxID=115357 RepID=UPI001E277402|nr:mitochondrial DNA helicase [Harmonia axyridis]